MIIDLTKTSQPSKIQPKIFQILKKTQKNKNEYLVVIDRKNSPMGVIVSPEIFSEYLEYKQNDLKNFEALSESSFDFWNNDQDDVYQKFYTT